jgi:hypothetical protein
VLLLRASSTTSQRDACDSQPVLQGGDTSCTVGFECSGGNGPPLFCLARSYSHAVLQGRRLLGQMIGGCRLLRQLSLQRCLLAAHGR